MPLEIKSDLENVDWEQLAETYAAAFHGSHSASLIESVFRHSYATRIAVFSGRVVGGVYAFSDGELDATIHGLCVHPSYQKWGIGKQLMESIVSEFGTHIAILLTAESDLHDFYRGFGFRPLKTAMALRFPDKDMEP